MMVVMMMLLMGIHPRPKAFRHGPRWRGGAGSVAVALGWPWLVAHCVIGPWWASAALALRFSTLQLCKLLRSDPEQR